MSRNKQLVILGLLVLFPGLLAAHPLAPSLLELRVGATQTHVSLKTPLQQPPGGPIEPILPETCSPLEESRTTQEGTGVRIEFEVACGAATLVGQEVGLARLDRTGTTGLVRVVIDDVPVVRQVINGSQPTLIVPARPSALGTIGSYVTLGVEHISFGVDHLLFVAGLLLLIRSRRALFATVTAFTVGHSITLAAAVLGHVNAPTQWIEVAIALSLVWLAAEAVAAQAGAARGLWRRPALVAAGFGLLHGFGFASALLHVGLPPADIPLALLSFNVGIELGQLGFIGLILLAVAIATRVRAWPERAPTVVAYVIGSLGVYWALERSLAG